MTILAAVALLAAQPAPAAKPTAEQDSCAVDEQAMMALGIHAFDQDMNGGWRPLAARDDCTDEAAELIRKYREFVVNRTRILYWHEGQLRAELGQTGEAIKLFKLSRQQGADEYGWNHYVDATIAFLNGDRPSLEAARDRLARSRIPDWEKSRPNPRPMNMNVVERFISCFGRTYREAYANAQCAAPAPG